MKSVLFIPMGLCLWCAPVPAAAELVIRDASVFNSRTKSVDKRQSVIMRDGLTAAVVPELW